MRISNKSFFDSEYFESGRKVERQFKPIDDLPIDDKIYIDKSGIIDEEIDAYTIIDNSVKQLIYFKKHLKNRGHFLWRVYIQDDEIIDSFKVRSKSKLIFELPIQFRALYNSIEESKYILELEENWDDEGAPAIKESTWERAVEFICKCSIWTFSATEKIIDPPEIHPGPNGSIDLLWKKKTYRLLINIPEDSEKEASYYGDDYKSQTSKGTFNTSSNNQGLLSFLSLLL